MKSINVVHKNSHQEKYHMKLVIFDSKIFMRENNSAFVPSFLKNKNSTMRLNIGLGIVYTKVCGLKETLIQICFWKEN